MSAKPFVIEMPTPAPAECGPIRRDFVLRNTSAQIVKLLSPNELVLWMTLRRLADAKSGALAFRGAPISAERIQKEARMGPDRRKETMRRLMAKGLVLMVRQHIVRNVGKRQRYVYQRVQYWVSEIPRSHWVSCGGRAKSPPKMRVSSTDGFFNQLKKPSHNSSQKPPRVVAEGFVSVRRETGAREQQVSTRISNHQGSTNPNGDDSRVCEPPVPETPLVESEPENTLARVDALKKSFLAKCKDPYGEIAAALDIIEERHAEAGGSPIQHENFFAFSVKNFFENDIDREELRELLRRRRSLPGPAPRKRKKEGRAFEGNQFEP